MNRLAAALAGAAAVLACTSGCGNSNTTTSTPATTIIPTATAALTPTGVATVKTAKSPLGQILTDGAGRTLYLFEADTGTTSTCSGACAAAWPPQLTTGTAVGTGVNASMLGTTKRAGGLTQVTYNGHPLYYFAADTQPGATSGQGVNAFGALWYAVGPNGTAVTATASGPASASASGGVY